MIPHEMKLFFGMSDVVLSVSIISLCSFACERNTVSVPAEDNSSSTVENVPHVRPKLLCKRKWDDGNQSLFTAYTSFCLPDIRCETERLKPGTRTWKYSKDKVKLATIPNSMLRCDLKEQEPIVADIVYKVNVPCKNTPGDRFDWDTDVTDKSVVDVYMSSCASATVTENTHDGLGSLSEDAREQCKLSFEKASSEMMTCFSDLRKDMSKELSRANQHIDILNESEDYAAGNCQIARDLEGYRCKSHTMKSILEMQARASELIKDNTLVSKYGLVQYGNVQHRIDACKKHAKSFICKELQ